MSFITVKQSPAHPREKLQKQPGGSTRTITRSTSGTRATMSRRPGTQPDWEFREAEETSHLFVVFALSESLDCISSLVIIDLAQEKTVIETFYLVPSTAKAEKEALLGGLLVHSVPGRLPATLWQLPGVSLSLRTFPPHQGLPSRDLPLLAHSAGNHSLWLQTGAPRGACWALEFQTHTSGPN